KRQSAALELLESERVYVSYLSLLLKANITFNGSEAMHIKDKRPFPSSLRFLIQQHLELLHVLQERVLKCQWQGIMGDVFMKLTSKESDFLDYYVAYLKELPECLSVVNMYSASSLKASSLFQGDATGDEHWPSLHALLLQPVQRIPEYLLLLQNLLKHTVPEHPDYYLLLICIQQFQAFTLQCTPLLQHNEELLQHNRKELKRSSLKQLFKTVDCGPQPDELDSCNQCLTYVFFFFKRQRANQVKRSKQKLLEQMQCKKYQDWEDEPQRFDLVDGDNQGAFFSPDTELRLKPQALQSIPETEQEGGSLEHQPCKRSTLHSTLGEQLGEFLLPGEALSMEGVYKDADSLHNALLFDNCSTASSDSSIDIAFVRCPKSHAAEACTDSFNLSSRGWASPEELALRRCRPLQAIQRKSKSLNGLQLDSPVSNDILLGVAAHSKSTVCQSPLSGGGSQHAKLECQSSKGSAGCKAQRSISPLQKPEAEGRTSSEEDGLRRDHEKVFTVPIPITECLLPLNHNIGYSLKKKKKKKKKK
ncbi:ARG33 factor, partial [Amia calva]|nr:ARG33 factor [Amia calva]